MLSDDYVEKREHHTLSHLTQLHLLILTLFDSELMHANSKLSVSYIGLLNAAQI